jgi:hypothetical protein
VAVFGVVSAGVGAAVLSKAAAAGSIGEPALNVKEGEPLECGFAVVAIVDGISDTANVRLSPSCETAAGGAPSVLVVPAGGALVADDS